MVQIFLLTYNRPEFVVKAVDSVLSQDCLDFQLTVSDNSTNNKTRDLIQEKYVNNSKLIYIKREPSLSAFDHFSKILSEANEEYFMMFHDDDIMYPSMVTNLLKVILKDNSIAAVGANAFIIKNGKKNGTFRRLKKDCSVFNNRTEFSHNYLNKIGCVPFPSYLYRTSIVNGVKFDLNLGGKYSDVSFLMSISDSGKIVFVNEPLMDYYIHNGQDSGFDIFEDRMKLIYHISQTTNFSIRGKLIRALRMFNIYGEIKNRILKEERDISIKHFFKYLFLAIKYSPTKVFPRLLYLFLKCVFKQIKSHKC